ncbi:asparaginase domain-containing protein [Paenibacillus sp. LHD-38]|uniref:asparaginase n=1 Tax=Paenibacillus sp. LHD-38 TaxID=3072143 RepID=UPI00280C8AD3|nr:asparaginase domain-containing protein [Paenibacillus sp. LHD-38]MDQ8734161.1 asparaginase domain-containing protein [Paenibacillus sp. LHD-38]
MKQLLVVFTGGTIGSRKQGEGIDVDGAGSYSLIDDYNHSARKRSDVTLHAIQPLNLLSENLTTYDWITLAQTIRRLDLSPYDGLVITHGSDTLAYIAAMISYLFADTRIPFVLTASNYPLADERSNGRRNFVNAIDFAAGEQLPGVFVVYEDDKGDTLVYLGTRITQAVSFTDQFGSPYGVPYGKIADSVFSWLPHARNPKPETLRLAAPKTALQWEAEALHLDSSIVYIRPYPGLDYTYYDFSPNRPKAVLHDLHHSGTACAVEEGPYSLPQFIARCKGLGIDVYICPIRDRSDALYSSSLRLIEAGAIVIEKLSVEAALTKLMLAYGMHEDPAEARAFATESSLYFEHNEV